MENMTKTGLLLLMIGILIGIISNIILFFLPEDISGIVFLMLVGLIAFVGGLLALIGGLLIIIGRKEFGEEHSKFAVYALIIFVVSTVASFIMSMVVSMISFSSSVGSAGSPPTYDPTFMIIQTAISAILGGLVYVFLLYHLENENGKRILIAAYIVSIVISVIIAWSTASTIGDMVNVGDSGDITSSNIFSSISSVTKTAVFGVISSVLYLIAIYIPYNRITSGELVPLSPTTAAGSSAPSRICPNCGQAIPFDANICPYCSKRFDDYL